MLQLTTEQIQLQKLAREFASREVAPKAAEFDKAGGFPAEILEKIWELGFATALMPESCGGLALGTIDSAIILEEIAAGCSGIAHILVVHIASQLPLILFGTETQKQKFLAPLATQFALAGYLQNSLSLNPQTTEDCHVQKTANGYMLNGKATYLINTEKAAWYYLTAQLQDENVDPAGHTLTICPLIVPCNSSGITVGPKIHSLGLRALPICHVEFVDVSLDKSSLIIGKEKTNSITVSVLERLYPMLAAISIGIARAAMEHAIKYSKERKAFGVPISQHQAVALMLADMAKNIEAARSLTRQACLLVDNGVGNLRGAMVAKIFAQDMVIRNTTDAVQVFGGYGYSQEYPVEKLMRDAMFSKLLADTNESLRFWLGNELVRTITDSPCSRNSLVSA